MTVAGYEIVDGEITWSMANNNLIGTLIFESEDETEQLNNYRIKLKHGNDILTDSGILYTNNYIFPFLYQLKNKFC